MTSTDTLDPLSLVELHIQTLFTFTEEGDLLTTNDPFPPTRLPSKQFHLGWCESGTAHRFRHDVPTDIRDQFETLLDRTDHEAILTTPVLTELERLFDAPDGKVGTGPAYTTEAAVEAAEGATRITRENESLLPDDFLADGEIEAVDPFYAVVEDGKAVSTCHTVRRAEGAIEAGVDTVEGYRGRGYAVQVTRAWVNKTLSLGLRPFYSTWSENTASQRVAEKVGLTKIATEIGVR